MIENIEKVLKEFRDASHLTISTGGHRLLTALQQLYELYIIANDDRQMLILQLRDATEDASVLFSTYRSRDREALRDLLVKAIRDGLIELKPNAIKYIFENLPKVPERPDTIYELQNRLAVANDQLNKANEKLQAARTELHITRERLSRYEMFDPALGQPHRS